MTSGTNRSVFVDDTGRFDGRSFANEKLDRVRQWVAQATHGQQEPLTIVSIFAHEDPASVLYTKLKRRDAESVGMVYTAIGLSLHDPISVWRKAIDRANHDSHVRGVLVQKPATTAWLEETNRSKTDFHTWWSSLAEQIALHKDIDGLSPNNLLDLAIAADRVQRGVAPARANLDNLILPATAQAVIDMAVEAAGSVEALRQRQTLVLGRSVIVGRPTVAGLQLLGCPVSYLKSADDPAQILLNYQVIITATGQESWIPASWLASQSILIDVGAPTAEFQSDCYDQAACWTPVPNGVGPVTRACLLENVSKNGRWV